MSILLKNATFVDYKTFEFKKGHIKVLNSDNSKLEFFDDFESLAITSEDIIIDCTGKYVTKSFACGHHHVYSALARGMGGPLKPTAGFYDILKYLWWAMDKSLDKLTVEASAYATAIACAKNGVTFVIDHHASPFFAQGSLEIIAEIFEKVGVAHLLCFEISDRDGHDVLNNEFEASENYLKSHQGLVGLHASFTVSDETLRKAVLLLEKYNSGIHIHVAEDLYDQTDSMNKYYKNVVERLNEAGVLNFSKSILVHCLHLNEKEREIIANSPVYVAQNIESNLNNNVGIFNGRGLGKNVMLGTDGMHSDMLRSFKAVYFYGQTSEQISMDEAYSRFRNVHEYVAKNNFKGDGDNNLVVFDYKSPTPVKSDNFLAHLIFGIEPSDIQHVIANGELIVKNCLLTKVNEEEIMALTQRASLSLWSKFKNQKV